VVPPPSRTGLFVSRLHSVSAEDPNIAMAISLLVFPKLSSSDACTKQLRKATTGPVMFHGPSAQIPPDRFSRKIYIWTHADMQILILPCEPGQRIRYSDLLRADGPWTEFRGGGGARDFTHWPWSPPCVLYNGYRVSFPRVKRPGPGADPTHSCLAQRLKTQ
jgi:hypothetical protein